jgi:tetratricopeptide (TPR) repeat protein
MTPEEAIQVADEVLLTHFGKALTDIQRMILSESLAGKGYESMEGYSSQHIKNEGKILWDLLSEALKEPVRKKTFKGALEKRFKLGNVEPKAPQPSNYDERNWVGREKLVSELLTKLQVNTRVLWLTGLSGIGKTALGECLASQAWQTEPSFHWIYFEILEGSNPNFVSVAAELLNKLGERDLSPQERNDPDQIAQKLVQKLKSRSYWIQIDSLERLLHSEQPIEFFDPYWKTFIQCYLTEPDLISRLVITAQTFPNPFVEFNDRYPNVWTEIRLNGLLQTQPQLEFFRKRGLDINASNQSIVIRIAQIYEGHPLVLKVISEEILEGFEGDVVSYWETYQSEFEQVARELQFSNVNKTEYDEVVNRKVRERIRKTLDQLLPDALALLCRSAVFRRPVPKKFWLEIVQDFASEQKNASYQVLMARALIEKEGAYVRQHNLVRSIAYDMLKAEDKNWRNAEYRAAHLWLNTYRPTSGSSNLESLRGFLEAFDHYCEVEDWELASNVYTQQLSLTDQPLCQQLLFWGYYNELIKISNILLSHEVTSKTKRICLSQIGASYRYLGNIKSSIDYCKKALRVSLETGDVLGEASALGNLGGSYLAVGEYKQAINCHKRVLVISQQVGNRQSEAAAYGSLGIAYSRLGDHKQANFHHRQYLSIARESSSFRDEAFALLNLGNSHFILGDYEQSINYYQQSLALSRKIDERRIEADSLNNLGIVQMKLEQYPIALENLLKGLEVYRDVGGRDGEAETLKNLADLYQALRQFEDSRYYCRQALAIATDLGLPLKEECENLSNELEKNA